MAWLKVRRALWRLHSFWYLDFIEQNEVIQALPKLIKLNPIVVKEVFNRLLGTQHSNTCLFSCACVLLLIKKYIQSFEKVGTPYWNPWFSISGHIQKISGPWQVLKFGKSNKNVKIWDKYGMFGKLDRRKLLKNNIAVRFRFAKLHLNKTTRLLEQCSLNRWDQRGDVRP